MIEFFDSCAALLQTFQTCEYFAGKRKCHNRPAYRGGDFSHGPKRAPYPRGGGRVRRPHLHLQEPPALLQVHPAHSGDSAGGEGTLGSSKHR